MRRWHAVMDSYTADYRHGCEPPEIVTTQVAHSWAGQCEASPIIPPDTRQHVGAPEIMIGHFFHIEPSRGACRSALLYGGTGKFQEWHPRLHRLL